MRWRQLIIAECIKQVSSRRSGWLFWRPNTGIDTKMQPVVTYDGECRFCLSSVGRMQRMDRRDRFVYLPRQAAGLEDRYPLLANSHFNTGLRLIERADKIYSAADAVYQMYRRRPPFNLLAWLYRVAVLHLVFRAGYALIAKYRHRLGAVTFDTSACDLSSGERRAMDSASNATG